ncbi:hypothetical protein DYB37_012455 [Aphanomyces astaci]|uniref:Uncharacterized protein n=1 Tax=Aphanomyces astaci TaxID=112090 RepID=A0A3R6WPL8_APHAT|nr:hypothetical protein DYB35_002914 [Aphanomyces astaci]RHZ18254.1 hypothetical protein DYB37_012455 [Aphanomyces astaci]
MDFGVSGFGKNKDGKALKSADKNKDGKAFKSAGTSMIQKRHEDNTRQQQQPQLLTPWPAVGEKASKPFGGDE